MLELLLCSLLTILPDYLYRRYVQGKRFGKEITLYSVWFELRWGITACLMLTVGLITVVFYNHPSTTNATLFFRTVPILPETNGRVAEIYVGDKRSDRQGRADLQARQLEAGGRGGDGPPQDRRGRGRARGRASRHREGRRPAPGGRGQSPAGRWTNWRPSRSCTGATPASLRSARSRSSRSASRRRQGAVAAATAAKQAAEVRVSERAPGREGQRRSRAGAGPGGSGQDRRPRRRERARGAVLAAGRRHRQSADAPGRSL